MIKRIIKAALIIYTSMLLSQCGGGTGTTLAEGGISGTGIRTAGTITGFGSIWVNGIRYDVSNAKFIRDGSAASGEQDYRIGEIINITGKINNDNLNGQAESIEFDSAITGTVTEASPDNSTIVVLGQTIYTDGLTIYHAFNQLSELQQGNMIEVSARFDAQQRFIASSITLLSTTFITGVSQQKMEGTISNLNIATKQFQIGAITINYSNAVLEGTLSLSNGQYVEVSSTQDLQNTLINASQVTLENETSQYATGTYIDMEGIITQFTNTSSFTVNQQAVITSAQTLYEYGTAQDIQLNELVEVEGTIDSQGKLLASKIELMKAESSSDTEEWSGTVTRINTTTNELILNNLTFFADNNTIIREEINDVEISLTFNELKIGDELEIYGRALSDNRILALRIEREDD